MTHFFGTNPDFSFSCRFSLCLELFCPAYSASNMNSDTQNYENCVIYACASAVLEISGCAVCSGDQYLRLYDANGTELASNDDGVCGYCSSITYTVPSESPCQAFQLHEGCYNNDRFF